ncbi:DUF555 domain-containing protein [Halopiger aswanensis]|uniref:UPF0212 protein ATJ93_0641 n=1 Tax=Halopiger aswanensis TaxID=148449 RepID=A0A3R7E1D1_9EURY|nr:DUF555 domain-containing protein [Halopiger aswanensis]RKD97651.1 uncharacterized protein (UPF0212 family) [Halopiger aswanensis]
MNCRVVVEAAVPVFDVETEDEAIRIAISKTGEMLNPDLNYVEINMGERTSPSGEELPPAFIAADEALVALELEMTVFNVEREEHASRIARKEIGQRLENIPLEVTEVEVLEEDELDEESEDDADADAGELDDLDLESDADSDSNEANAASDEDSDDEDDEVLPEFEDLVE